MGTADVQVGPPSWDDFCSASLAEEGRLRTVAGILAGRPEVAGMVTGHQGRTVRETVCHLAVYYPAQEVPGQVRKLLGLVEAGFTRRMPDLDLDVVNAERIAAFDGRTLGQIFAVIHEGRSAIREQLTRLDPRILQRPVAGTRWGTVTAALIIEESTFGHDRLHLDEIFQTVDEHAPREER